MPSNSAVFVLVLQSAEAKRNFAKIVTIMKCDCEVSHFARTKGTFDVSAQRWYSLSYNILENLY
jgi:hypothetical protein